MNNKEIIRMAREAGIDPETDTLCRYEGWVEPLERFAALVAAAERKACAKVCKNLPFEPDGESFGDGVEMCISSIRARGQK